MSMGRTGGSGSADWLEVVVARAGIRMLADHGMSMGLTGTSGSADWQEVEAVRAGIRMLAGHGMGLQADLPLERLDITLSVFMPHAAVSGSVGVSGT